MSQEKREFLFRVPHLLLSICTLAVGCYPLHKNPTALDERIDALIAKIDENPDILHAEMTPSVLELAQVGEPVIPKVLPLMERRDDMTRLRAQNVLTLVTQKTHGFSLGYGWDQDGSEDKWRAFWHSLGDLRYDAPLSERQKAITVWNEWIRTRKDKTS